MSNDEYIPVSKTALYKKDENGNWIPVDIGGGGTADAVQIKDANGNILNPATLEKQDEIKSAINAMQNDVATESTLSSIDSKVATETTLSSIDGKVATASKQDEALTKLDTIADKLTYKRDLRTVMYIADKFTNSWSEVITLDLDPVPVLRDLAELTIVSSGDVLNPSDMGHIYIDFKVELSDGTIISLAPSKTFNLHTYHSIRPYWSVIYYQDENGGVISERYSTLMKMYYPILRSAVRIHIYIKTDVNEDPAKMTIGLELEV